MRRSAAVVAIAFGLALIVVAFALDRIVMLDQEVMLSFMLAMAPAGVFLLFEGVLTLWRDARLQAVEALEKS